MSSFPDVISTTISVTYTDYKNIKQVIPGVFTVPSQYAFAVIQVCFPGPVAGTSDGKTPIVTSHGLFYASPAVDTERGYSGGNGTAVALSTRPPVSYPILNLIIKGGERFTIGEKGDVNANSVNDYIFSAKITALCHKKPS